jgi:hypothetical protein
MEHIYQIPIKWIDTLSNIFLDTMLGLTRESRNAVTRPEFGVNSVDRVTTFQQRLGHTHMLSNALRCIASPMGGDFFRVL